MSAVSIEVDKLSKCYRLGQVGAGSLKEDLGNWWRRVKMGENGPPKGRFWALQDISFSVNEGEVLGVIGANGAGKSTLLKILSRITEPTSGAAKIKGRMSSLLEVGTGFHPDLTGRENVFLNGAIMGLTRADVRKRFDQIVAFAGVEDFIDTPVKRYSSGMHVRLGFAVAAHLEPDILIVDEVLAVGDAGFQDRCIKRMDTVAREGRTVLIVSHIMPMITRLCHRTLMLEHGRIAHDGPPRDVIKYYLEATRTPSAIAEKGYIADLSEKAGKRAFILSLVAAPTGQAFAYGESLRIDVSVSIVSKVERAVVQVAIDDIFRGCLAVLSSDDSGVTVTSEGGEVASFRITISDIRLHPGTYRVTAAIKSGAEMIDYGGSAPLAVSEALAPSVSAFTERGGQVTVPGEWTRTDSPVP